MVKAFTRINSAEKQNLHDNPQDEEKMRPEETETDLPDVKDIPGAELDDANEDIGAEDEEKNIHSRGETDNDNINEGTP